MSKKKSAPDEATQNRAYTVLSGLFDKYERSRAKGTLSIEVLPPGLDPPDGQAVLEDETERSIGLPKKVLVAAFLHARHVLVQSLRADFVDEEILSATRSILLFDPEYLTAANIRKRRLVALRDIRTARGDKASRNALNDAIESELWFLSCILTSPLHRQSKSPTLWYHRLWVYEMFNDRTFHSLDPIMKEFDTVLKAAERHQHNYYAFQYARRLVYGALDDAANSELVKHRVSGGQNDLATITAEVGKVFHPLLTRSSDWSKRHPSDTSGWSFLLFLMQALHSQEANTAIVEATLKFATDVRWKGEALWHFLRTVSQSKQLISADSSDDLIRNIQDAMVKLSPLSPSLLGPRTRPPSR